MNTHLYQTRLIVSAQHIEVIHYDSWQFHNSLVISISYCRTLCWTNRWCPNSTWQLYKTLKMKLMNLEKPLFVESSRSLRVFLVPYICNISFLFFWHSRKVTLHGSAYIMKHIWGCVSNDWYYSSSQLFSAYACRTLNSDNDTSVKEKSTAVRSGEQACQLMRPPLPIQEFASSISNTF